MSDLTEKTDAELHQLITDAKTILRRRESEREAGIVIDAEIRRHAQASGRNLDDGQPFVQPTGAHDAYPKGSIVTHDGKTWTATRAGANGIPGASPDWRQIPADGEVLEWQIPHAGSEYGLGDRVHHEGRLWESEIDRNGFEPGQPHAGWTDIGPWPPEEEPGGEEPGGEEPTEPETIPDWVQPTAGSEYPVGAIVQLDGHVWENSHDRNGWRPGTTGSQWLDLGPVEDYQP